MIASAQNGHTPVTFAEKLAARTPQIAGYLRLLHAPGDVFEVRALDVGQYSQTHAGFFDDADKAAEAIARLDMEQGPRGIYLTINPVQAELLCRINNRLGRVKRGEMSADTHVLRRRWLFVDLDPKRLAGIPANDAERELALERAEAVCRWLMDEFGWHEPIRVDSGNGQYLLFPIDLPNNADATLLIKRVLAGISEKWSDNKVEIDVSVCNASRIARVFGTANRKGDSTEERPHRFANHLYAPDYLEHGWADPLPLEKLQAVAALAPVETKGKPSKKSSTKKVPATAPEPIAGSDDFRHRLLVEPWLTDRGIEFRPSHEMADGRTCWPILCPFKPDHQFDACLTQDQDGKLGAKCLHNSCAEFGWQEFKEKIGKPDGNHYDPPLNVRSDQRPEIVIGEDEHRVIDETVAALTTDPELYQRGGSLVMIVREAGIADGIERPTSAPRSTAIQPPTLRERITKFARIMQFTDDQELVPTHPKEWQVKGVFYRGQWDGIRPLTSIARTPLMRPDGTILSEMGYDPATGVYLDIGGLVISVPEHPNREQAQAAAAELMAVFSDFPFEERHHESAVLALILTTFSRLMFKGPAPLFEIDANVRGSGKTLLADGVGLIATGDDLPRMSNPSDDDEARKRITSLALRGDSICLIDNIGGQLGCASLDAALTSTRWQDRILGRSEITDMPLVITWLATGNNIILAADTSRRVCPIRLNCQEERPEERQGFKHPDLRQFIRDYRGKLVSAALTILRGYHVAERPQVNLCGWGSYESWSSLIRQCVVWLGMPDPANGRIELMSRSDVQASALRLLIESWHEVDPSDEGLTTGELLALLGRSRDMYLSVREAILELCGGTAEKLPSVRTVGNKLRHVRHRIVCGKMLDSRQDRTGAQKWRVTCRSADSAVSADSISGYPACAPAHTHAYAPAQENLDRLKTESSESVESADPNLAVASTEATSRPRNVRADAPKLPPWITRTEGAAP